MHRHITPNKLQLVSKTYTPGDIFNEMTTEHLGMIVKPLVDAGIGPIILWGDVAMRYYGIPSVPPYMQLLVPIPQFDAAVEAYRAAGYPDEEVPNYRGYPTWSSLGRMHGVVIPTSPNLPRRIRIHDFSMGGGIFNELDLSLYTKVAGVSVPPLRILATSFLRTVFSLKDLEAHMLYMLLLCWCVYTMSSGYNPLGHIDMRGMPGITERMAKFWDSGCCVDVRVDQDLETAPSKN